MSVRIRKTEGQGGVNTIYNHSQQLLGEYKSQAYFLGSALCI